MERLQDRVAVITGGGGGIGAATARRFAQEGARVVVVDLSDEAGQAVAEEVGGIYLHADVTSAEDVERIFATAAETYGSVDIAFNNAGISPPDDDSILVTGHRRLGARAAGQHDVGLSVLQGRAAVHAASGQGLDHQHGVVRRGHGGRDLADRLHREQGRRARDDPGAGRAVRPRGHPGQRACAPARSTPRSFGSCSPRTPSGQPAGSCTYPWGASQRPRRSLGRSPSSPVTTRPSSRRRRSSSTEASRGPTSRRSRSRTIATENPPVTGTSKEGTSVPEATTLSADEQRLAELGYKQELNRSWSGFSNFAISFSIISILAGCFTTFAVGWNNGGPAAIAIGWPIISAFILIIGFCMSELVSAYPDVGRHLLVGLEARRSPGRLLHGLAQPHRPARHRGVGGLRRGDVLRPDARHVQHQSWAENYSLHPGLPDLPGRSSCSSRW